MWILGLGLLLSLGSMGIATSAIPKKLHYQGYLTDNAGTPIQCDLQLCDVPVTLTFRIYNVDAGEPWLGVA